MATLVIRLYSLLIIINTVCEGQEVQKITLGFRQVKLKFVSMILAYKFSVSKLHIHVNMIFDGEPSRDMLH